MDSLYRLPWFLDLQRLTQGVGWGVHAAAVSYLEENSVGRLPRAVLPLILASVPARLHKAALTTLVSLGLWVEDSDGYELLAAPGLAAEAPAAPTLSAEERRRAADRERQRKYRDGKTVTAVTADVTPPAVTDGVTVTVDTVTEAVTVTPSERDSRGVCVSSSEPSSEENLEEHTQKDAREGVTAGPVTADVTPDVTAPVTPTTPAPAKKTPTPKAPTGDAGIVLAHWVAVIYPSGKKPLLTPARHALVSARLRDGYTVEQLCQAIDGAAKDDFLMGRKEGSPGYKAVESLLGKASTIERCIALAEKAQQARADLAAITYKAPPPPTPVQAAQQVAMRERVAAVLDAPRAPNPFFADLDLSAPAPAPPPVVLPTRRLTPEELRQRAVALRAQLAATPADSEPTPSSLGVPS